MSRLSPRSLIERLKRRARRRVLVAAYSVMEAMMALGVLTVGATGVIALQKATIIGNVRARDLATANAVASTWMERLRVDALLWRTNTDGSSTILSTQWLNAVGNDYPTMTGNEGVWIVPQSIDDYSAEADVRGKDINADNVMTPGFCSNIRLTQLTPSLIRAEVRVFWLRHRGGGPINSPTQALCAADPTYLTNIEAARDRYHFVYSTSGILRNDASD